MPSGVERGDGSLASARPKGFRLLAVALGSRKSASMLALGFSSGLPYALLIGTLNAWLGDVKVDLATIGVLSWIGLAYAFKFLWSPVVDRLVLPGLGRIGRRKSWIMLCQIVMVLAFCGLAVTNPATDIGTFAVFAAIAALGSATQDVAVDAWRIDVADEVAPVELLSAIYQFGYRTASIVGGAFALFLAARISWMLVFLIMAALIALMILVALVAPDTDRPAAREGLLGEIGELKPAARLIALAVVAISWIWAIGTIGHFMVAMLAPAVPGAPKPSVADFMKHYGPWIIGATVLVPLIVAAVVNRLRARGQQVQTEIQAGGGIADHLYTALISPLTELTARLGWGVLGVIGFILTYTLCYNIWASFAFPFYLDFLHYSKDEVAFASKLFGIFMTMLGVGLGGVLFLRLGRFPTVMIGAVLPILGNFLYADLADGAAGIDAFAHLVRLDALAVALGSDERMMRLLITIAAENISTGLAGAAFVAYVSSIVAKRYAAVQYSLLSSLTFLIGSLARGVAGEAFDRLGYAAVFRQTALVGLLAVLFVALEWWRATRVTRTPEPGHTGEPA
jgi:PAT family beta-lactamase induction signal transducer AmpG